MYNYEDRILYNTAATIGGYLPAPLPGALPGEGTPTPEMAPASGNATVPVSTTLPAPSVPAPVVGSTNTQDRVDSKSYQQRAADLSKQDRSGKDFTPAGKSAVKEGNAAQNGGQMQCENCKTSVQPAQQHTAGVTPPANEAHVDHVIPKAKGGSGTPANGQVLCRGCNIKKSDN